MNRETRKKTEKTENRKRKLSQKKKKENKRTVVDGKIDQQDL